MLTAVSKIKHPTFNSLNTLGMNKLKSIDLERTYPQPNLENLKIVDHFERGLDERDDMPRMSLRSPIPSPKSKVDHASV